MLLDQPFSFRFRLDDNVLTIKDVRFGLPKQAAQQPAGQYDEALILMGRWKKKTDSGRDSTR